VRKIGSVIIFILLVSANAWSQTIPLTLQGSWGANGSQAIRINADGSGEWGAGNLAQSATFRVTGNTLRVQAMNMEGQMQWRIDKDTLFLTNPTGFLGELLIAVMKNGGVDRLTRMGTSPSSGNSSSSAKKITITGITSLTGLVNIFLCSSDVNIEDVWGQGSISNNSVTFSLRDTNEEKLWTGSGSYVLYLDFDNTNKVYFYTNGKTFAQLGISLGLSSDEVWSKLPKYNISSTMSTIPFSQFVEMPEN